MGLGKLWITLFCVLLIVGFFVTHGYFADLAKKTEGLEKAYQQTKTVLKDWKEQLFSQPAAGAQATPDEPLPSEMPDNAVETATEPEFACVLRAEGGKIGVYTPDGYLIRILDVDLRTLPESDLAALAQGVPVASRAELLERMEDFGE